MKRRTKIQSVFPQHPRSPFWHRVLAGVVVLLPVGLHVGILCRYAVNIAKWDDHALRNFLVNFYSTNYSVERVRILFAQHNEHRIAYDRVVALVLHFLTGEINFVALMVVGNAALLGILLLFYRLVQRSALPSYYFLPLPFLLLTLQHHENTFWGMAALQNFTVVAFALGSLYALSTAMPLVWAVLLAIAAVCTSGNGILLWPVGVGVLFLQKRWGALGAWLVLGAATTGLYFWGYSAPADAPPLPAGGFWQYARGLLIFLGGVADCQPTSAHRSTLPLAVGFLLLAGAAYFSVKTLRASLRADNRPGPTEYFTLAVTGFVLLTAAAVVRGRLGYGEWVLLTSRVKIYSAVLLLTLVLAALRAVPLARRERTFRILLIFSILFNGITAFTEFDAVIFHRHERLTWLFNARFGAGGGPLPAYDPWRFPYRAPRLPFDELRPGGAVSSGFFPVRISVDSNAVRVENRTFTGPTDREAGSYLLLQTGEGRMAYLFPTRQARNRSRRSLLGGGSYWAAGFTADVGRDYLPAGRYRLGVVLVQPGGALQRFDTGQTLRTGWENKAGGLPGHTKNW